MTYYIKALAIISLHPVAVLSHPRAGFIFQQIAARKFRLHWLRDVARESVSDHRELAMRLRMREG